jgi:iron complex outermembrane receptor protein
MMKNLVFFAIAFLLSLTTAAARGEDAIILDPLEVTATKTGMDRRFIPFTYYSISKEEDQKRPDTYFSNVGEMVRDLPGVEVGQFYPWGMAWIQLRGTGNGINRSVMMVDGLPIYVYQGSTINTHDISRVDVLLGPSSALYGSNASGGVVNMITQGGHAGMGANLEFAFGSNNTYRPHFHIGDAIAAGAGVFRYYFSYTGDLSDGFQMQPYGEMLRSYRSGAPFGQVEHAAVQDNDYRFHYLASRLDWENGARTKLSLSLNYANRWLDGGQPGYTAIDDGRQWITSFHASTPVGEWGEVKLAAGYQDYKGYSLLNRGFTINNGVISGPDPTPTEKIIAAGTGNREQIPVDLQLDIKATDHNTVTVGGFYSHGRVSPGQVNGWTQNRQTGEVTRDYHFTETQYSVYLQDSWLLLEDRLSLVGGMRYDNWTYDDIYNSNNNPRNIPSAGFDNLAWRFGAKYLIGDQWGIRAAYGTAYWQNPQYLFANSKPSGLTSIWRLPNHDLKPEKTWMAELGVDFSRPDWGTEAGVTVYYGRIKDVHGSSATFTDTNGSVTGQALRRYNYYRNFGEVEIHGVELALKQYLVPETLYFQGSATFNHSRITEDANQGNVGNHLSNAPDYSASLGLYFTRPRLFSASAVYRHTDDRYYDNNNNEFVHYHMGDVDLLDAKIWRDWKLTQEITLTTQLSATNITDAGYEALYTYMGPGRYFEGMVGFRS